MSIQKRLVGSYLIVIFLTVCILEVFLMVSVKYYYYTNIERVLMNQADLSASFFHQYFAEEDLEQQSERLIKGFAQNSTAQVQIIGSAGQLLQDSTGQTAGRRMMDYPDVQEARSGSIGRWKGQALSTNEDVLAVSYPLQAKDVTVGVVRFVTSLTETEETMDRIYALIISVGVMVVAIVTVLGIFLSRTITSSITELKQAAEQMAEGDFSVTAKKRYQDELGSLADTFNSMAAKLRLNEQLKNEFIASVSHELRTPLTSIKGWVVTLHADREHNDKLLLQEGLDIIETETDRLTDMVDELLDFSKLDNGRMELSCSPLPISSFIHHIGKQLAPRAARQSIALEVHADDRLPIIHADANRLKQVLINVLDNALKFTDPHGSIKLHAYTDMDHVVITVEDTGCGIAEEDLAQVVHKFYKGNHRVAGSGLGLSISEQIIQLHGGELRMESQVGLGTKVRIVLPK